MAVMWPPDSSNSAYFPTFPLLTIIQPHFSGLNDIMMSPPWYIPHLMVICVIGPELTLDTIFHNLNELLMKVLIVLLTFCCVVNAVLGCRLSCSQPGCIQVGLPGSMFFLQFTNCSAEVTLNMLWKEGLDRH